MNKQEKKDHLFIQIHFFTIPLASFIILPFPGIWI